MTVSTTQLGQQHALGDTTFLCGKATMRSAILVQPHFRNLHTTMDSFLNSVIHGLVLQLKGHQIDVLTADQQEKEVEECISSSLVVRLQNSVHLSKSIQALRCIAPRHQPEERSLQFFLEVELALVRLK